MRRLACVVLGVVSAAAAQKPAGEEPGKQVFAKVSASVVVVLGRGVEGKAVAQGSGVVVAPEQVVTNCHVLGEAVSLEVRSGEHSLPATRSRSETLRDLCLLHVPGLKAPAVVRGQASDLRVGQRVYAVGAPMGLELTLSEGIVSSLRQLGNDVLIQTTAPFSPGSSGGGLFDAEGQLVGITAFQFSEGQNLNFALPAEWIAALLEPASEEKAIAKEVHEYLDWLTAAAALEQKEDWEELLRHAQARVQQHPDDEVAWFALGVAYANLGQYQKAVEAYQRAIAIEPDDARAWLGLGLAHCGAGNRDATIEVYKKLRTLDAGIASKLFNISGCIVP